MTNGVIIVSNRLPVSVTKVHGELIFAPSSGGLATGLASYAADKNNMWVGWPGIVSEELSEADKDTIVLALRKHNCYPVFLTKNQVDGYYNGYSNSVLWPLFHNLPTKINTHDHTWQTYRQVNQLFAETVMGLSLPTSTIWVHDYQLLLVPKMLRAEQSIVRIGFFLHIPFPTPSTLNKLSHAKSLLSGMLGSDLIGFHTGDYVQNFLDACQELHLGSPQEDRVVLDKRVVNVTNFPLGIDYDKFADAGKSRVVKHHQRAMRRQYGRRRKIILTVDRLDPTKGLVGRLEAYQELLRDNKHLHKKVVMVMLAIPSRAEIDAYKKLKSKVEQLVMDINLDYSKRNWQPVHYMYKSVPFEELAALYRVADVAFIAPIKDGMNLVAKEYVASRPDKRGVLILSETAGAAQELTDALMVNPSLPASLVEGLSSALTMSPKELRNRLKGMKQQLTSNTVHHWKFKYMSALRSSTIGSGLRTKHLDSKISNQLLEEFKQAKHPTILLDYDGVLAAFNDQPSAAKPDKILLRLLGKLAERVSGGVLIISGRNKLDLGNWLGSLPLTLAAEHGALLKPAGSNTWRKLINVPTNWKSLIMPVLQKYADKTPGAFVEEKDSSLVWHHRQASPFYAQKNITILRRTLKPLLKTMGLEVYRGNMILEIKSPEANKGVAASNWVQKKHDLIMAIGDDYTDEDMFASMPEHAYTIKVGRGRTIAKFRLNSVAEVQQLLQRLTKSHE